MQGYMPMKEDSGIILDNIRYNYRVIVMDLTDNAQRFEEIMNDTRNRVLNKRVDFFNGKYYMCVEYLEYVETLKTPEEKLVDEAKKQGAAPVTGDLFRGSFPGRTIFGE